MQTQLLQIINYIDDHGTSKIAVGKNYKTSPDTTGKFTTLEIDGRFMGFIQAGTEPTAESLSMEVLDAFTFKWLEEKKKEKWENLPSKVRTFLNAQLYVSRYQDFLASPAAEENVFVKMLVEEAVCKNLSFLFKLMREIEAGKDEWKNES